MSSLRTIPLRIGAGWKVQLCRLSADRYDEREELLLKLLSINADGAGSTEAIAVYFQRRLVHEAGYFIVCYTSPSFGKSYRCADVAAVEVQLMELASRAQPELQSFAFPSGWYIHWNHFITREPLQMSTADWENALWLTEDLALYEYRVGDTRWTIDIGFYPENSPEGAFGCYLLKDHDWEMPVGEFHSPCQRDVVLIVQQWIDKVSADPDGFVLEPVQI